MSSESEPLAISREDLYELVWSKPMVELAKDFGLSDVALAKRCRKLGVPIPGRGYWARVEAGQTPRQPPLKKRKEEPLDTGRLTFDAPREADPESKPAAPPKLPEYNAKRDQILFIESHPVDDLRQASPAIKRTALHLKRPWKKEIKWTHGEKTGPIVRIDVSEICVERALRLCELLLRHAGKLGWPFVEAPKSNAAAPRIGNTPAGPEATTFGVVLVENEPLSFRIDERKRQVDRVLTDDEKRDKLRGSYYGLKWDHVPTGELRLHLHTLEFSYIVRTWKDQKRRPLEEQIKEILSEFLEQAVRTKTRREEERLAEIQRRREDALRWELRERRNANKKLIAELEAQAGAWFRARMLRSYLRALRRRIGDVTLQSYLQKQPVDFLKWAEHYVDQLDTLHTTPHDEDLMKDDTVYGTGESDLNDTLSRLMGREWQIAWKLSVAKQPNQQSASSTPSADNDASPSVSPISI